MIKSATGFPINSSKSIDGSNGRLVTFLLNNSSICSMSSDSLAAFSSSSSLSSKSEGSSSCNQVRIVIYYINLPLQQQESHHCHPLLLAVSPL